MDKKKATIRQFDYLRVKVSFNSGDKWVSLNSLKAYVEVNSSNGKRKIAIGRDTQSSIEPRILPNSSNSTIGAFQSQGGSHDEDDLVDYDDDYGESSSYHYNDDNDDDGFDDDDDSENDRRRELEEWEDEAEGEEEEVILEDEDDEFWNMDPYDNSTDWSNFAPLSEHDFVQRELDALLKIDQEVDGDVDFNSSSFHQSEMHDLPTPHLVYQSDDDLEKSWKLGSQIRSV